MEDQEVLIFMILVVIPLGNDTLSDQGTDTDDAIVFEGIPNNHSIIYLEIQMEKNDEIRDIQYSRSYPNNNTNSINTINTPISNGKWELKI